ncbi:MAG: di-trans,poly-cis-decaprenylcistransferase [Acidobacteria bacterium]|nr:di-trans,poly-cis-decaprenylcistransferase [Acidobacteriota bacterium]MBI3485082.1 di-trans,poly-cis-decaprenylcistransferase [Acidobacteriota bacterium]
MSSGIPASSGLHVAIIPDGNGRWAVQRGRPRRAGHRAGAEAIRRVVDAAADLGIGHLTLFAFSSDNWERPAGEVEALFGLVRQFLLEQAPHWVGRGVRLRVIGRRDRLPTPLRAAIASAEEATAAGQGMQLRIAVDYSAREEILRAATRFYTTLEISQEAFGRMLARLSHTGESFPDVDLLIRTGGEQRLSDFLLWECAYAEMIFSKKLWPDFGEADLEEAIREYHTRPRRFGRLQAEKAG